MQEHTTETSRQVVFTDVSQNESYRSCSWRNTTFSLVLYTTLVLYITLLIIYLNPMSILDCDSDRRIQGTTICSTTCIPHWYAPWTLQNTQSLHYLYLFWAGLQRQKTQAKSCSTSTLWCAYCSQYGWLKEQDTDGSHVFQEPYRSFTPFTHSKSSMYHQKRRHWPG